MKSIVLQPSKSPQATISIARDPEATERGKKGHLRSPLQTEKLMALHRPDLALKLGLSCHLDTVRAHLRSPSMSKTVLFWCLFFRSATAQEWHSGPHHQSLPSGIYTPAKQGQKSHDRKAGFDRLLPTALKTENWKKKHMLALFPRNNGKSPATDLQEKKKDLLGNMFASCCPITFTQSHKLI